MCIFFFHFTVLIIVAIRRRKKEKQDEKDKEQEKDEEQPSGPQADRMQRNTSWTGIGGSSAAGPAPVAANKPAWNNDVNEFIDY